MKGTPDWSKSPPERKEMLTQSLHCSPFSLILVRLVVSQNAKKANIKS